MNGRLRMFYGVGVLIAVLRISISQRPNEFRVTRLAELPVKADAD